MENEKNVDICSLPIPQISFFTQNELKKTYESNISSFVCVKTVFSIAKYISLKPAAGPGHTFGAVNEGLYSFKIL